MDLFRTYSIAANALDDQHGVAIAYFKSASRNELSDTVISWCQLQKNNSEAAENHLKQAMKSGMQDKIILCAFQALSVKEPSLSAEFNELKKQYILAGTITAQEAATDFSAHTPQAADAQFRKFLTETVKAKIFDMLINTPLSVGQSAANARA